MNAIPFGKGVPAFGKAAEQGFGRKGGAMAEQSEASKQDGGATVWPLPTIRSPHGNFSFERLKLS